jgi:hypothetical protein
MTLILKVLTLIYGRQITVGGWARQHSAAIQANWEAEAGGLQV